MKNKYQKKILKTALQNLGEQMGAPGVEDHELLQLHEPALSCCSLRSRDIAKH